jgi:thiamine biosynthesis protein ThiS
MTTRALRVIINGESQALTGPTSLAELVTTLNLKPEQVAIELNQVVVRRTSWENTMLKDDDQIEIVHFVGGG